MELTESHTGELVRKAMSEAMERSTRYRLYARKAKEEGYLQISDLLTETADHEMEHAGLLYELFHGCFMPATEDNLQEAVQNLSECGYSHLAQEAEQDGFPETGRLFQQLSEVEKNHQRRFQILLDNIQKGDVFQKSEACYWVCRICGGLHFGKYAPQVCPVCGYPQSCFSLYAEDY